MGLLDDAIREHLELKRLSGADPGVVAREEKDALGPVPRRGEEALGAQEDSETELPSDTDGSVSLDSESAPAADLSGGGQETVEINMEAELEAGADYEGEPQASQLERKEPVASSAHAQTGGEDSLEWEVPADRPNGHADSSGSDREGNAQTGGGHEVEEHIEDVLEETPDFLRDTPEQERLWFEQRPPRDFDFNE